ncbi:Uncharacterised protein [Mycobacteroides abscessus subsp. abscessus]|nr:Uncharacterised protein [Mycobacteroides abscessus subsp. abscessus]
MSSGPHPRRVFTDHQPMTGDSIEQTGVPCRVRHIHTAGQHRNRDSITGQRGTMRNTVDAERSPRNHRHLPGRQAGGEFGRNVFAVTTAGSRPDERRRSRGNLGKRTLAHDPQRQRHSSIGHPLGIHRRKCLELPVRPLRIVGRHQAPLQARENFQILATAVDVVPGPHHSPDLVGNIQSPNPGSGLPHTEHRHHGRQFGAGRLTHT